MERYRAGLLKPTVAGREAKLRRTSPREWIRELLDACSMCELRAFVPPAAVIDKPVYSGFARRAFHRHLQARRRHPRRHRRGNRCLRPRDVLGAIDLGYRVIVVRDAVCSVSDDGQDSLPRLFGQGFGAKLETMEADEVIAAWR